MDKTTQSSKDIEEFKARPIYLIPILASLLAGLGFSYLLLNNPVETLPVTPLPDTPSGSLGNALYFVIILAVAATVFYLLIKRRNLKIINVLIGFALTSASVLLSLFYLYTLLSSFPNWEIYVITLS